MSHRNRTRRLGSTAVEFALVAPVILTLVFGMMEWSRFEMIRQVSSTAAFSAARVGTLPGATIGEMEQRVDQILDVYGITNASRTASITADQASIAIQIPMADNSWVLKSFFGSNTIQRSFTLSL